ncbi:MAG: biotin--[acetyl-CoA-carboxylase] ligase [Rhodococcus sp. (in: high G+C Gram-positive bacteria)]
MWENLDRPALDGRAIARALVDGPRGTWSKVDVVARTGSTNADLLAVASTAPDRSALIADAQDAGRGRHSRPFTAPPRSQVIVSALASFPGIAPASVGWLPLLTGIVVVDVLRSVSEVDAVLKWPNDVLLRGNSGTGYVGGKVAGILVEVASTHPVVRAVAGVGINVTLTEDELPVPTATSLQLAGATVIDRGTLVRAFLRGMGSALDDWRDCGWDTESIADLYRSRCDTLGRRVRVTMPGDTTLEGTATDIDEHGRVVIVPESGDRSPVAISAGDVTHLRAVDVGQS